MSTNPIQKKGLVITFSVTLIAYHLINLVHYPLYSSPKWGTKIVDFKAAGQKWFSFPSLAKHTNDDDADFISKRLGTWAMLLRYMVGERDDALLYAEDQEISHKYVRSEVRYQYPQALDRIPKLFFESAGKMVHTLADQGIHVVILPVPTKLSIERDRLPASLPEDTPWNLKKEPYQERPNLFYEAFNEISKPHVLNLFEVFSHYRSQNPKHQLFLPYSAHWSSLGQSVAARAVIKKLNEQGLKLQVPEIKAVKDEGQSPPTKFDFFSNPTEEFLTRYPRFRWTDRAFEIGPTVKTGTAGRIVVVGTCFSHHDHDLQHNLGRLLSKSLGRELVDFSYNGAGIYGSIGRLADSDIRLRKGDILVWEFTLDVLSEINALSPEVPIPKIETGSDNL